MREKRFLLLNCTISLLALLTLLTVTVVRVEAETPANSRLQPTFQPRVTVIIELESVPAAHLYSALVGAGTVSSARIAATTQAHIASLHREQEQTLTQLAALDIVPLFTLQRVYNGIAARVRSSDIKLIQDMEGVKAIHPSVAKYPTHSTSVPHIGAPLLWKGLQGTEYTGTGISIGIIDTGIDYIHTDFGGHGDSYGENDPTIVGDVPDYPGSKVVGGYDFAGNSYNADYESKFYQPVPEPDADPADCYGHGTHVAGTAAGYGVRSNGATYAGTYNQPLDLKNLRIGPGVAPHANLYALKIFGCSGSTELTELAIEWAVDPNGDGDLTDHLDVINLSLGSPFGSEYDPSSIAADNAAMAGVIVVASAGNSGDTYYVTGSPGTAQQAVSVASILDQSSGTDVGPTTSGTNTLSTFSSRGPRVGDSLLKPDLAAPGQGIYSAASGSGDGGRELSGTSMATPHVAGGMALLRQHAPDWSVAELKARLMNTSRPSIRSGTSIDATLHGPTRIGSGLIDLPAALATEVIAYNTYRSGAVNISFGSPQILSQYSQSARLRLKNKGDKTESYRIDYSPRIDMPGVEFKVPLGDLIEIAAGQVIDIPVELSANPADMQHSRDKTVNAIQGQARHWMAEEAGYLLLWPADGAFDVSLSAAALATPIESDSQATAGLVFSPTTGAISYTIEVEATSPVTEISLRRAFPDTNGQIIERLYSSNPTGMVAGAVTELFSGTVVLGEFDKALLTAGNIYLQINTATFPDGELRGPLQARTPILNVPIHAAPRPTALLSASPELTFGPDEQSRQSLVFSGVDLSGSRPPTDVISLASVFVLQSASPPLPTETGGTKSTEAAAADIQYVGIVSDYEQVGSVEGSMLYFTITTYGKRSSPAEVTFNILIDIDEDGDADFRLFNADELGYVNRFRHSDAFVAVVEDLNRGVYIAREPLNALSPAQINSGVFEANFIVLPVRAASLGLNSERNRFSYGVSSELPDRDGSIDLVSKQQYDLISAQILPQLGGEYEPYVALFDGATIPIHYSGEGGSEAMRLLVIQPHNDIVEQVQIVDVDYRWLYDFYLPALVID